MKIKSFLQSHLLPMYYQKIKKEWITALADQDVF